MNSKTKNEALFRLKIGLAGLMVSASIVALGVASPAHAYSCVLVNETPPDDNINELFCGKNAVANNSVGTLESQAAIAGAMTYRVAPNAPVLSDYGVGLKSGKVACRAGFQVAW